MDSQAKSAHPIRQICRHLLVVLAGVCLFLSLEAAIAQGSGSPQLAQAVNLKTGQNGPSSVVLADVNGDGLLDMVVANEYGGGPNGDSLVSVFLGNGDGTFQPPVNYDSGGPNAVSVYVANVNGDGYPDIFVLNQAGEANGDASIGVLTNDKTANGTFNNSGQTPTTIYDAGGTDPNTNSQLNLVNTVWVLTISGKPAIVVSNQLDPNNPNGDGSIGVLLQNAQGGFGPVTLFDSGGAGTNVLAVMDVNGDGLLDVVVANSCSSASTCSTQQGSVTVLLNNGNGAFGPAVSYPTPGFALAVAVGDLNGDGIPDILVSSGGTGAFINNGNGTFQSFVSLGDPGQTVSVAIQDVNGDGINDLVVGLYSCATCDNGNDSGIAVALGSANSITGKANGTFGPWQTYDTAGQGVFGLAFGHLISGDTAVGTPDIVTANLCDVTDPYCGGNDSVFLNQNAAIALTSTLAGPVNSPIVNASTNLTFTVNNPANLALGPGTITLYDGTTQVQSLSVPVFTGASSFTFSWTPSTGGTHNLAATYAAAGATNANGFPVAPESSTAFLQQNVVVPKTLQSVSVTPANPTIVSGATEQFDAVGLYSDGTTADVTSAATWSSSFAAVAAVNGPGSVLAVGPGQANISATVSQVAGQATLAVTPPATVPVMAPVAYYSTASIGFGNASVGSTQSIALINAGETSLTLSSASVTQGASNFSVSLASCSTNSTTFPVTIPAGGSCVFTITYLAATTASGAITFANNASLSNVTSSGSGSTYTQVIPINPSQSGDTNASPEPLVDEETISVNDEVFITPLVSVAAPVAEYSFSTLGFSSQPAQTLSLSNIGQQNLVLSSVTISGSAFTLSSTNCSTGATSPASITLPPGGACYLSFGYNASNGPPTGFVTFLDNAGSSNLTSIAAGSGTFTQTVTLNGSASSNTPIGPALLAISISPGTAAIAPGATQQFVATGTFSDGTTSNVTGSVSWSSSSMSVATISNQSGTQGLSTGVSAGTTTIAATSGSIGATATLNVSLVDSELISVNDSVVVGASPLITSANSTSFAIGKQGSFAVTTVGTPAPAITESGALPNGVSFSAGVLVGTPTVGSAGSYPITLTATNTTNPGATQSFILNVTGSPIVTLTALQTSASYGSTFTVTATTNAGVMPTFTGTSGICMPGSATGTSTATAVTVTMNSPSGICIVTANWPAIGDYLATAATLSIAATQAIPVITWPAPAAITYGTALGGSQLDATATSNGVTIAGKFTYSPAKGTVLTAGSQTLTVTFTPTASADYTTATASVTLQVNPVSPKITWAKPAAITYGTALSSTQLDASSSVPGSFEYSPANGTVLSAGKQTLQATFTPTDQTDYTSATDTVTIAVNQATPTVTWASPAPIVYGTTLSGTQLDATASVPGSFVYSPAAGTLEPGGSDKLSVTFKPTDSIDYVTVTASVTLQVNPAPPVISWATPAAITYGTGLNGTQLDATTTFNGATVAGSYTYSPNKGAVLGAGSQSLSVTFTPTNTSNYVSVSSSVSLQVNQATPKITWSKPSAITYGTALSGTQLDVSASVSGTLAYSPVLGTVLAGGVQTLSVSFTPADAVDYAGQTDSVNLTVNPAASAISITSTSANPALIGQPVTVNFIVTGSVSGTGVKVPTGAVTVTASTGEKCSGILSSGSGSCSFTFTAIGSPKLTAAYSGDTNFKVSSSAQFTQRVN